MLEAKKYLKTPEEIAQVIHICLEAMRAAQVTGLGYQQNVSDKYLDNDRCVGLRDDRGPKGEAVNRGYVGEHAYWRTRIIAHDGKVVDCNPQWADHSDEIKATLGNLSRVT